ncbi:hypothetical protein EU537_10995 [Candidatus Thorarchaeota archaeon]|nr:MAG: hypothetical protein EU537_10995 [Candidatus Thorarchaeota archaeon]
MSESTAKIEIVHPFIRYEREFVITEGKTTLSKLMELVLTDAEKHGRYSTMAGRRIDRLKGCVVVLGGDQVGYIDKSGFVLVDNQYDSVEHSDVFIIMVPITGG